MGLFVVMITIYTLLQQYCFVDFYELRIFWGKSTRRKQVVFFIPSVFAGRVVTYGLLAVPALQPLPKTEP